MSASTPSRRSLTPRSGSSGSARRHRVRAHRGQARSHRRRSHARRSAARARRDRTRARRDRDAAHRERAPARSDRSPSGRATVVVHRPSTRSSREPGRVSFDTVRSAPGVGRVGRAHAPVGGTLEPSHREQARAGGAQPPAHAEPAPARGGNAGVGARHPPRGVQRRYARPGQRLLGRHQRLLGRHQGPLGRDQRGLRPARNVV